MIWVTPNPQLFRNLCSSCLNFKIIDLLIKIAGSIFGKFWQMVVNWNLGSFFLAFSRIIYRVIIQPVITRIEKRATIILEKLEQKFIFVQDEFYRKMEDLFTFEDEPGNYVPIVQNINGQQFTYQYQESVSLERTFVMVQKINNLLLNVQGLLLANFEKTWIWVEKIHNHRNQPQVFAMPDFEITNPEIFDDRNSELLSPETEKRDSNFKNINNKLKTITLKPKARILFQSLNSFSMIRFNIFAKSICNTFRIKNTGRKALGKVIQIFINQLFKKMASIIKKQEFQVLKKPGFRWLQQSNFYRKL
jgi:hypothetical protein